MAYRNIIQLFISGIFATAHWNYSVGIGRRLEFAARVNIYLETRGVIRRKW